MKKYKKYSTGFKEQALVKVYSRSNEQSIQSIANSLNMNLTTPSVSNDNPYSESLFKTLKYRPQYPLKPFADITEARKWVTKLVEWYNNEHRHSAIGFVTPVQRHEGLDEQLLNNRKAVYETAYAKNPKRWSGNTRNWQRIQKVHLNPDKAKEGDAKDIDVQTRKVA